MIPKQLLWAYSNGLRVTSSISLLVKAAGLAAGKGKWHMCCIFTWITPAHAATEGSSLDNITTRRTGCLCSRCDAHHIPGLVCPWQPPPREHCLPKSGWRGRRLSFCVCTVRGGRCREKELISHRKSLKWPQFPMLHLKSWHSWSYFPYKTCAPPTPSSAFNERNT